MLTTLETIFTQYCEPESLFTALLPALCKALETDRCFLHVRNPATRRHQIFCWCRHPDMPDVSTPGWQPEQPWEQEDPMFAAALRTAPSIFVEDVETAAADTLNLDFERTLGHRSLVHAHLCQNHQLWGILQPCIFGSPRIWTDRDQAVISYAIEKLVPVVIDYVKSSSQDD